jgi:tRNA U54 and U55 pseudouridine synthase Pus10
MSTTAAELSVTAEHVARYREKVASLARPLHDEHEADAVAAMYEAERALRTAQRLLERAADLLRS